MAMIDREQPVVIELGEGDEAVAYVRADVFRDALAAIRRAHEALDHKAGAHTMETRRDRVRFGPPWRAP